jgi:hypothetical protein
MRQYLVASCLLLSTAGPPSLARAAPSGGGSADGTPEPSEFEVRARLEHWARYYGYRYPLSGALREYVLEGAPALGVDIGWLPFAWPSDEARTGFHLNYSRLLHAVSRIHDAELETQSYSLGLGLKARFAAAAWVETAYELLYGEHSYTVADTFVPDPHYRFIRPGALLRVKLWRLRATAAAGMRLLVDTGGLESPAWYPEAGGLGLDAELTCGAALTEVFAVLVGIRWQTYRFDLNPNPTAPSPGGAARLALDVYLETFVALNLLL